MPNINSEQDSTVEHLYATQKDVRDEIKRRIEQRDKFILQQVVSTALITGFALSEKGSPKLLLAVPFVWIYFTGLVL